MRATIYSLVLSLVFAVALSQQDASAEDNDFIAVDPEADNAYSTGFAKPTMDGTPRYDLSGSAPDKQKTTNQFFRKLFDGQTGSFSSCSAAPTSTTLHCSYVQHMALVIAIGAILCFMSFVGGCCFFWARCCPCCNCRVCCHNCGGKKPKEGGYSTKEKRIWIGALVFVTAWTLVFSAGGTATVAALPDDFIAIIDALIVLVDIPDSFLLNTVKPEITVATASVKTSVANINAGLNKSAEMIAQATVLRQRTILQLEDLSNYVPSSAQITISGTSWSSGNRGRWVSGTSSKASTALDYHWKTYGAYISAQATIDGSSTLNKRFDDGPLVNFVNTTLNQQVENGAKAAKDGLSSAKDSLGGSKSTVDGMRSAAIGLGAALFGLCWFAQIFVLLGVILQRQACFSCAYLFFCCLLLFYFITFIPTYLVGHIMSDFCTIFPSAGKPTKDAEFVLKGQGGSMSGMFTHCLMKPEGDILTAINYNISGGIDSMLDASLNIGSLMPSGTLLAATNNSALNGFKTVNTAMISMVNTTLYGATTASYDIHAKLRSAAASVETTFTNYETAATSMESTFSNFDAVEKANMKVTINAIAKRMSKCETFSTGYTALRDAWCDQLLVTWDATYFTQFALLVMSILNMIVLTFAPKRLVSKGAQVAPSEQKGASKKPVKKPVKKEKATKKK